MGLGQVSAARGGGQLAQSPGHRAEQLEGQDGEVSAVKGNQRVVHPGGPIRVPEVAAGLGQQCHDHEPGEVLGHAEAVLGRHSLELFSGPVQTPGLGIKIGQGSSPALGRGVIPDEILNG